MKQGYDENTDFERAIQLIYRGITDEKRSFQGEQGISETIRVLDEIRLNLNERYNNNLPIHITEIFRMTDYIINRLKEWFTENNLLGNYDAEIFHDSLCNQLDKLEEEIGYNCRL